MGIPPEYNANLMADLIAEVGQGRKFQKVYRQDAKPEEVLKPTLRLEGRITKFNRGNRTMRYVVGMGAGKTVLKAHVRFVDAETGQVVFEKDVDGKVIMGLLGGESAGATRGLAKEVAKVSGAAFF